MLSPRHICYAIIDKIHSTKRTEYKKNSGTKIAIFFINNVSQKYWAPSGKITGCEHVILGWWPWIMGFLLIQLKVSFLPWKCNVKLVKFLPVHHTLLIRNCHLHYISTVRLTCVYLLAVLIYAADNLFSGFTKGMGFKIHAMCWKSGITKWVVPRRSFGVAVKARLAMPTSPTGVPGKVSDSLWWQLPDTCA